MTDFKRHAAALFAVALLAAPACAGDGEEPQGDLAKGEAYFTEHVLPILEDRCTICHSHEWETAEGGLVLDSRAGWQSGGNSGPAVTPGKPAASLLYLAVSDGSKGLHMPPDETLPAKEIAVLKRWIESGAADPRDGGKAGPAGIDLAAGRGWWAFQPLPPSDPQALATWGEGDAVDPFIDAQLADAGLTPAPPADPATLLRRLSHDLTGLPPDAAAPDVRPEDLSTDAGVAAVVDRLLASRHFGERWGRHWLDLARYADSNGSSFNPPFREAWRYRNWVIEATNDDLPIDRFFEMQLAGDLLPAESPGERDDRLVATGYLLLGSKVLGAFDKEQLTLDVADEQIDVISKSMLGLTVACARCHDHKFDPIPQKDYYALAGILTSTATLDSRIGGPKADESDWARRGLGPGGDEALRAFLEERRHDWVKATQKTFFGRRKIAELERDLARTDDPAERSKLEAKLQKERDETAEWEETLAELEAIKPPHAMAVRDAAEPADEALRVRGVPASRGEIVPRGFLQVATVGDARPTLPPGVSGRRELAAWIASDENPLTPRVFVNRVWKHLLRQGIVRSVDNFGVMGEEPSHPELLDMLARRFIDSGWSLKQLIREIVLSDVYQRGVAPPPAADPENRLLASQNRRRLDAEELRDGLLYFGGHLDRSPGRGALDALPIADLSGAPDAVPSGDDRRTVYQPLIRTLEPIVMRAFDAPVNTMATGDRPRTVVAPQALYFLNDEAVTRACEGLAERLADELPLGTTDRAALDAAAATVFAAIVGRAPGEAEAAILTPYLVAQADGDAGLTTHDAAKLARVILAGTQFQFLD